MAQSVNRKAPWKKGCLSRNLHVRGDREKLARHREQLSDCRAGRRQVGQEWEGAGGEVLHECRGRQPRTWGFILKVTGSNSAVWFVVSFSLFILKLVFKAERMTQ